MKKLLIGNAALARGLYEAGVRVVSSYPGTPSTEITEPIGTLIGEPTNRRAPTLSSWIW